MKLGLHTFDSTEAQSMINRTVTDLKAVILGLYLTHVLGVDLLQIAPRLGRWKYRSDPCF